MINSATVLPCPGSGEGIYVGLSPILGQQHYILTGCTGPTVTITFDNNTVITVQMQAGLGLIDLGRAVNSCTFTASGVSTSGKI